MRVVVAGGHGQIAMLLHPLLKARGHEVLAIIRNSEQSDEVREAGADVVQFDLEAEEDATAVVGSADAIVFAAGAGPGSGVARKRSMDRDGAIKLMRAAQATGVRRYVMISAMDAETPRGNGVFQAYLAAKAEADEALRESGLDFTILRPGKLTNDPALGRVRMGSSLPRAEIPRADVASVIVQILETPATIGCQFDVTSGNQDIVEAIINAVKD